MPYLVANRAERRGAEEEEEEEETDGTEDMVLTRIRNDCRRAHSDDGQRGCVNFSHNPSKLTIGSLETLSIRHSINIVLV